MTQTGTAKDKDLVAGKLSPWLVWGVPIAALVVGGIANAETFVWPPVLAWMGIACLANALRCGLITLPLTQRRHRLRCQILRLFGEQLTLRRALSCGTGGAARAHRNDHDQRP